MVRIYSEEQKKLWATISPFLVGSGLKLSEDAPAEVVEALKRYIEIERQFQIEWYGYSTV